MKENNVADEIIRTVTWSAGPGCHGGCGVFMHVKDGKLMKMEGNPDHPYNNGRLCPRALAIKEFIYHPDRLRSPLKRIGKRGEDKWQKISWEDAYDLIENKMNKIKDEFGAESMTFIQGTGRNIGGWLLLVAYSYGSPNWLQGGLTGNSCFHPRLVTMRMTQGDYTVPDCSQFFQERYEHPEFVLPESIMIWGQNPAVTCNDGFMSNWIIDCMKRGTKAIVIDPVYTWVASKAAIWLQIRPGTDGALALGLLNVIINEDLYDKDFVQKWTHGFHKLAERVQEYSLNKVSEITWIPEDKIIEAARLFANSHPASIHWGVPVDLAPEGAMVANSIIHLWTITGNIDIPGGMAITRMAYDVPPYPMSQEAIARYYGDVMPAEQMAKRIGVETYPVVKEFHWRAQADMILKAMLTDKPYPLKGAWIAGNNMLASAANPRKYYDALNRLDFIIVSDVFMNPTIAALADVILPAGTMAERDGIRAWWTPLNAMQKSIEVPHCKPDEEMCFEMARRFNPNLKWNSLRELFDDFLKPSGLNYDQLKEKGWIFPPQGHPTQPYHRHEKGLLRPDKKQGFNTPTGKVELFSTHLNRMGYDPLPYYEEPHMSPYSTPELAKEYPLILSTGRRSVLYFHAEHRNIKPLRELEPNPLLEIHPDTARSLGIEDDDWVWVENPHGRCKRKTRYFHGIHPKVVQTPHGWWLPEKKAEELFGLWEVNVNQLIPDGTEAKCGFGGGQYKSIMCKVYKAEEGIDGIYQKESLL
ncbi:MAG: molybdopterin-dependent oxidoreductase [Desulfobacterales bacterium]|nr:molybdopterin-dependent oxidoreductase [Desulfobacterales bacterium]MDP6808507.1 molybdopterin-dependent oxidoreductase [Desulfobacterales bacterium]